VSKREALPLLRAPPGRPLIIRDLDNSSRGIRRKGATGISVAQVP